MTFLLVALAILICGGSAAAVLSPWPSAASWTGALSPVAASVPGLIAAVRVLLGRAGEALPIGRRSPGGDAVLDVDPLSAFLVALALGLAWASLWTPGRG